MKRLSAMWNPEKSELCFARCAPCCSVRYKFLYSWQGGNQRGRDELGF